MSTSRHINRICITAIALTLIITILFMCSEFFGVAAVAQSVKYERTIFDTSYVHEIDIVMDDWDSFIETCESEEYTSCTVVVDGNKHSNIAIRAKGNTSLSNVSSLGSQRYSFKLEFDHYEDGKSLDGLDKLCLNNLIQDNTMMKDYLVYQMMADFGVDTPLCSFVYLTVNGEDWGLYLAVEGIEESFLARNYGSDVGELYKPDSMSFGGGRGNGKGFNMADFDFSDFDSSSGEASSEQTAESSTETDTSSQPSMPTIPGGMGNLDSFDMDGNMPDMGNFDPSDMGGNMPDMGDFDPSDMEGNIPDMGDFDPTETGGMGSDDVKLNYIDDNPESYSNIFDNAKTDVSTADQERLIASLKSLSSYEDLADVLDMDEVLRYFVVHNFVCNGDSYTGSMVHNYYLHESDGQLGMIPWDYNLAFGTFQGNDASGTVNTSIDSPVSGGSVDDRPMVGWIFSDESYTESYHTLFSEFLEKWFTDGELETVISQTAAMISPYVSSDPTKFCTFEEFESGVEALTEFVTLRAQAVSNQLAGDSTAVDTGDLNLSDMGTMNTGTGGGSMPNQPGESGKLSPDMPFSAESSAAEAEGTQTSSTVTKSSVDSSAVPSMPGGQAPDGQNDTPPEKPDGNPDDMSTPLDRQSGEAPSNLPENGAEASSEKNAEYPVTRDTASSDNVEVPNSQAESDDASSDSTSSTEKSASGDIQTQENSGQPVQHQSSDKNADFSDIVGISGSPEENSSVVRQIVWVVISFMILILGLLIAIKKKY